MKRVGGRSTGRTGDVTMPSASSSGSDSHCLHYVGYTAVGELQMASISILQKPLLHLYSDFIKTGGSTSRRSRVLTFTDDGIRICQPNNTTTNSTSEPFLHFALITYTNTVVLRTFKSHGKRLYGMFEPTQSPLGSGDRTDTLFPLEKRFSKIENLPCYPLVTLLHRPDPPNNHLHCHAFACISVEQAHKVFHDVNTRVKSFFEDYETLSVDDDMFYTPAPEFWKLTEEGWRMTLRKKRGVSESSEQEDDFIAEKADGLSVFAQTPITGRLRVGGAGELFTEHREHRNTGSEYRCLTSDSGVESPTLDTVSDSKPGIKSGTKPTVKPGTKSGRKSIPIPNERNRMDKKPSSSKIPILISQGEPVPIQEKISSSVTSNKQTSMHDPKSAFLTVTKSPRKQVCKPSFTDMGTSMEPVQQSLRDDKSFHSQIYNHDQLVDEPSRKTVPKYIRGGVRVLPVPSDSQPHLLEKGRRGPPVLPKPHHNRFSNSQNSNQKSKSNQDLQTGLVQDRILNLEAEDREVQEEIMRYERNTMEQQTANKNEDGWDWLTVGDLTSDRQELPQESELQQTSPELGKFHRRQGIRRQSDTRRPSIELRRPSITSINPLANSIDPRSTIKTQVDSENDEKNGNNRFHHADFDDMLSDMFNGIDQSDLNSSIDNFERSLGYLP